MELLPTIFSKAGFPPADVERIARSFSPKDYAKDDHFVRAGQVSVHLGFVEHGMFQYYFPADGEERTTYVTAENTFLASVASFLNGTPSNESIRALTHARIWRISKEGLKTLLNELPSFKDYYIGLLEWQIGCIDKSRHELLVLSAEQRYQRLVDTEPELLQRIPLQYLASILGVTPRHLSRIRKLVR
jgi:CRP-like cAMP-binding protein